MKKIIPLLLVVPFLSQAEDMKKEVNAPTGAFGIEFGQKLSTLKVLNKGELTSGEAIYQVQSPNPLKGKLDQYFVLITPKTQKVHTIWGNKEYKGFSKQKCEAEKSDIVSILENKYGESKPVREINIDNDRMFEVKNVNIFTVCQGMGSTLSIRYVNNEFSDLADQEKKESVIEKTDASML